MNEEDIIVWADGTWCFQEDLESMNHMSDDYMVIEFDSNEFQAFLADDFFNNYTQED